tara:strand:- start:66 stop:305 length:240 start_codon:yes stop_codon:yes gene_type:complete
MKNIHVYGSGCKNCVVTAERIQQLVEAMKLDMTVDKVTDLEAIMNAGVVSTPAVGIDGQLVHSGSVPGEEEIRAFLSKA